MLELFRRNLEELNSSKTGFLQSLHSFFSPRITEKIDIVDIQTPHANYSFIKNDTSTSFKIEVKLITQDFNKEDPLGFVIENIPPVLHRLLSAARLSELETDRIPSELIEVINDYRSQFGRDGCLNITQIGSDNNIKQKTLAFLKSQSDLEKLPGTYFYELVAEFFISNNEFSKESELKSSSAMQYPPIVLSSQAVVERAFLRRNTFSIKAWDDAAAPMVLIENCSMIPSIFNNPRITCAITTIRSENELEIHRSLTYLTKKSFRLSFSNKIEEPRSSILISIQNELEDNPYLHTVNYPDIELQISRVIELLKGREVLVFDRIYYPKNEFVFERMKICIGKNAEAFISFSIKDRLEMRFLLPAFNYEEDRERSLTEYVVKIARIFAESPADAVDMVILDQNKYEYPQLIDPNSNQEYVAIIYGVNINISHGIIDIRAINILLALYSSDIFNPGIRLTPLEDVLSRKNTYKDLDYKITIAFENGLVFDICLGGYGISSVSTRYINTNGVVDFDHNHYPFHRLYDELNGDTLHKTIDILRQLVIRGSTLSPDMIQREASRIIFDITESL